MSLVLIRMLKEYICGTERFQKAMSKAFKHTFMIRLKSRLKITNYLKNFSTIYMYIKKETYIRLLLTNH